MCYEYLITNVYSERLAVDMILKFLFSNFRIMTEQRRRGFFQTPTQTKETTKVQKGFFKSSDRTYEESNPSALSGLLIYSAFMFILPLLVFYGSKKILEEEYDFEPPWNLLAPAILAIATVNLTIVFYVCKALNEEKKEQNSLKKEG